MIKICKKCGWHGEPMPIYNNNLLIEILLWFVFIPIGIIYTLLTRVTMCGGCKSGGTLIPVGSKKGKELMEKYKKAN